MTDSNHNPNLLQVELTDLFTGIVAAQRADIFIGAHGGVAELLWKGHPFCCLHRHLRSAPQTHDQCVPAVASTAVQGPTWPTVG